MNHNKSINKEVNNLHEQALRLIYCDHSSNFQQLLQRDNSVTIHQNNIEALAIMMYKVVNNIASTIVSEFFSFSNVKKWLSVSSTLCKYRNGHETILYLGPKNWKEMKQKSSLFALKREIKQWFPNSSP